jgi:hypothetical protein
MGKWLEKTKLDEIDKSVRSRLFEVMDNIVAIETWRATLTRDEKQRYNHPDTVLRKWKAATKVNEPAAPKAPGLKESVANLSEEKIVLERRIAELEALVQEAEAAAGAGSDTAPHTPFDLIAALVGASAEYAGGGSVFNAYPGRPPFTPKEIDALLGWLEDLRKTYRRLVREKHFAGGIPATGDRSDEHAEAE